MLPLYGRFSSCSMQKPVVAYPHQHLSLTHTSCCDPPHKELTTKLVEAAKAQGAEVVVGTAVGVAFHVSGEGGQGQRAVAGVRMEGRAAPIACDKVVVAMGCVLRASVCEW